MTRRAREGDDGRLARWRCAAGLPSPLRLDPDPAADDSLAIT